MLTHEFFLVSEDKIPKNNEERRNVILEKRARGEVIEIQDEIILNNPLFLKGFQSYKVNLEQLAEGLSYHGFTIIPYDSFQDFQKNLFECQSKNLIADHKAQIDRLIALIEKAKELNLVLIHFGV